jgi:nicotinate-nucleotide adenylyltransferase
LKAKTGLFFGSFNPIHTGHLIVAEYMLEKLGLGKVIFVVSPQNPLKEKELLWPEAFRLELCKLAVQDNPGFEVSEVEFDLPRPSYSIHTLNHLKEKNPNTEYCLIMGMDNLEKLHQWKDIETILSNYQIAVYNRPGFKSNMSKHPSITVYDTPLLDISATHIRTCVQNGKSIRYLVPESVEEAIQLYNSKIREI